MVVCFNQVEIINRILTMFTTLKTPFTITFQQSPQETLEQFTARVNAAKEDYGCSVEVTAKPRDAKLYDDIDRPEESSENWYHARKI